MRARDTRVRRMDDAGSEADAPERPRTRLWQILLLLPQPPLSLVYLHLVRAGRVAPSFLPVIVLGALPLVSLILASRRLGPAPADDRPIASEITLVAFAITELAWTAVSAVAVGFAVAVRSG